MSINNTHRFALTLALSATLAACGGGGDSGAASGTAGAAAVTNTFSALVTTYVLPCSARSTESEQGTLIVSVPQGADKATATIHYQYYAGSSTCETAKLDTDFTVTGQIRDLSTTVNRSIGTRSFAAKVVEFRFDGLTLTKGVLTGASLPAFGVTTKVAFAVDGRNVYFTKGVRLADGLGDSLTSSAVTMQ